MPNQDIVALIDEHLRLLAQAKEILLTRPHGRSNAAEKEAEQAAAAIDQAAPAELKQVIRTVTATVLPPVRRRERKTHRRPKRTGEESTALAGALPAGPVFVAARKPETEPAQQAPTPKPVDLDSAAASVARSWKTDSAAVGLAS